MSVVSRTSSALGVVGSLLVLVDVFSYGTGVSDLAELQDWLEDRRAPIAPAGTVDRVALHGHEESVTAHRWQAGDHLRLGTCASPDTFVQVWSGDWLLYAGRPAGEEVEFALSERVGTHALHIRLLSQPDRPADAWIRGGTSVAPTCHADYTPPPAERPAPTSTTAAESARSKTGPGVSVGGHWIELDAALATSAARAGLTSEGSGRWSMERRKGTASARWSLHAGADGTIDEIEITFHGSENARADLHDFDEDWNRTQESWGRAVAQRITRPGEDCNGSSTVHRTPAHTLTVDAEECPYGAIYFRYTVAVQGR